MRSSSDGFQLAYVSPSCVQQSQLYCGRCSAGGNLQLMFRLRRGTEKVAIISGDPDSAQKAFVAVVGEHSFAIGRRQAVTGHLGQHKSGASCFPNEHSLWAVHTNGVGSAERVNLDELPDLSGDRARELIALEDALNALAGNDPRKARVVELRFFGGLSVEETAEVLAVSPETVMRDWKFARSWLQAELTNG
jgi:RNA polymerase sigma factor (sigma-70 family)